jgi:adenylosuccinate synthase
VITNEHISSDSAGSGIGSTKRGIAYVYGDRALRRGTRIGDIEDSLSGMGISFYSGLPPIGKNERALFEGAQGIMLDVDYGNYPYVTSSSVLPSIAHNITRKIGVMKAYTSRVGDGPPYYPDNEQLRESGGEYGTTTGRPRKCTWNDIDQLKYAFSVVQPDEVVVTKLDILDGMNISVYEGGKEYCVGDLGAYKSFLLERLPQIKWFSESPHGDMTMVV